VVFNRLQLCGSEVSSGNVNVEGRVALNGSAGTVGVETALEVRDRTGGAVGGEAGGTLGRLGVRVGRG